MQIPDEWIEGFQAYIEGKKLEDCPYQGEAAESWKQGWMDADVDCKD